jgi:hypothetical protein
MTTYYIATESGGASNGYLVANGEAFTARSGGFGRGNVPEGTYSLGGPEALNKGKKQDKSMSPGGKGWKKYRKFYISGVGPGEAVDPRYPGKNRTGMRFHYDGNGPGTEGCIGYDTIEAQNALSQAYAAGDKDVQVIHVKDDAAARAKVKELTGKDAPTTTKMAKGKGGSELTGKKKPTRKKRASQRKGDVSRIKKGAKMAEGERTVLLGKKRLKAAHKTARHTGGGRIAQGSRSVWVGKQMLAFGRVEDPTTDGSQVASGEDSVMVG